jgi:cell division transport system permease protein
VFLLKLSLRPWRLAPLSQLFSAGAVGFLLVLAGFLFWMQAGLKPVLARLQGEQVVTAYLDSSVEAKEEGKVVDSIRVALGAHAEGSDIRIVRAEQFMDNLKGTYPELARELEDMGSEAAAVVPRYVSVSGILPDEALAKVRDVPGVESAESSKDRYVHIVGAFSALRWVAKLLVAGLALALFTGLIHLSRMNAYLHRDALTILRLWGASDSMLRMPSMISGVIVGATGGAVAAVAWIWAGTWMSQQLRALSPMLRDLPGASLGLAAALLGCGVLIGLFAGALGGISGGGTAKAGER